MLRKLLTENYEVDQAALVQHIYRSLEDIQRKLEDELAHKQAIIDTYAKELTVLRSQVVSKDDFIKALESKIADDQRNIEGNRQLVNKLLNDLERLQQDMEWYKRTYEKRSLFGVIKDRMKYLITK